MCSIVACLKVVHSAYSPISSVGTPCDSKHEGSASAYSDRCTTRISPENRETLRQYATQNAHRWFNYAEDTPQYINGSQNLSIYLITGSSQVPADLLANPSTESTRSNSERQTYQSAFICGFKITKRQSSNKKAPANQEGRTHDSSRRTSTSVVDGSSLIASAHIKLHAPDTQHKETENVRIIKVLFQDEISYLTLALPSM